MSSIGGTGLCNADISMGRFLFLPIPELELLVVVSRGRGNLSTDTPPCVRKGNYGRYLSDTFYE